MSKLGMEAMAPLPAGAAMSRSDMSEEGLGNNGMKGSMVIEKSSEHLIDQLKSTAQLPNNSTSNFMIQPPANEKHGSKPPHLATESKFRANENEIQYATFEDKQIFAASIHEANPYKQADEQQSSFS